MDHRIPAAATFLIPRLSQKIFASPAWCPAFEPSTMYHTSTEDASMMAKIIPNCFTLPLHIFIFSVLFIL